MEKYAEMIRKKEFHIVFKGYKPEEVDKFLDIIALEFDKLTKKNLELQENLDSQRFESTGAEDGDIKGIIQSALVSAHKLAEDIKNQAKKEAEEIAQQRKAQEENELEEMIAKKAELEKSILLLQNKYEDFKSKLKNMVEDFKSFIATSEVDNVLAPDYGNLNEKDGENFNQEEVLYSDNSQEIANEEDILNNGPEENIVNQAVNDDGTEETASINDHESNTDKEPVGEETLKETKNINNLEGYVINSKRSSGHYFDRETETDKKNNSVETSQGNDSLDVSGKEGRGPADDNDGLKRERKKIDIANPDIIENFFRASDD